jgi:hypothetical protein
MLRLQPLLLLLLVMLVRHLQSAGKYTTQHRQCPRPSFPRMVWKILAHGAGRMARCRFDPGRAMGATVFRLFVSSPGDVAAERARAEAVVEKLNAELKDRARYDAVFWEDHFYSAHETFQKQIPEAADCDLVVVIFKARLGKRRPVSVRNGLRGPERHREAP